MTGGQTLGGEESCSVAPGSWFMQQEDGAGGCVGLFPVSPVGTVAVPTLRLLHMFLVMWLTLSCLS